MEVEAYELTRSLDPTRPINDASGYVHARTDLWTIHAYDQDPAELARKLAPGPDGAVCRNCPDVEAPYEGQPYFVDEFGGIKWDPETQTTLPDREQRAAWGYGRPPGSIEEFYGRLEGLVEVILSLPHVAGYAYTQLTDVEQERNGIYYFDRRPKFAMDRIRKILSRDPASDPSAKTSTPR